MKSVDAFIQDRFYLTYSPNKHPRCTVALFLAMPATTVWAVIAFLSLILLLVAWWAYRLYKRNVALKQELLEQPDKFMKKMEGSDDRSLILFQNSQHQLMLANEVFEKKLDRGPDDIFGKRPSELDLSTELRRFLVYRNNELLDENNSSEYFREMIELHEPDEAGRYLLEKRLFQLRDPGGSYVLTTLTKIEDLEQLTGQNHGNIKKLRNRRASSSQSSSEADNLQTRKDAADLKGAVINYDHVEQVVGYYPMDTRDEGVMRLVKSSKGGTRAEWKASVDTQQTDLKLISGGGQSSIASNPSGGHERFSQANIWNGLVDDSADPDLGFDFLSTYMQDIVAMHDRKGRILWVSPSLEQVLGFTPGEWKGHRLLDMIHSVDAERIKRQLGPGMLNQPEVRENRIVYRIKHVDGTFRWLETIVRPLDRYSGRVVTTSRDITDRKQSELRTQESEDLLRIILEQSPVAMAMLDRKGHVQLASRSWESWFDLDDVDISDRSIWDILPVNRQRWTRKLERCREGFNQQISEWFATEAGHYEVIWDLHPWYESDGDVAGIMVFAIPSEEKRPGSDQSSNRIPAMIRQRQWSETFLIQLAHALRTPLNGIYGYAQLLQHASERKEADEGHAEYINGLVGSSKQLQKVIEDLLELYQMESESDAAETDYIELKPLIEDIYQAFKSEAESKKLAFDYPDIDPQLRVLGSSGELRKVLIQLTDNAITYTDEGTVSIDAHIRPAQILSGEHSREVVIRLHDTGPGIPVHEMEHIRQPFYRINHNHHTGSGLGLTLADYLVDRMGGVLKIDSEFYQGTTVTIVLPSDQQSVKKQGDRDNQPRLKLIDDNRPLKALLVDDLKHNRLVGRVMLEQLGFECLEASNGLEAVRMVEEEQPDVVLMDQIMPVMNGDHAVKKIREMSDVVVIAVTGSTGTGGREWFIERGFNDYLQKPYPMASLERKLHHFFPDKLAERN